MFAYVIRRIIYLVPQVLGICLLTFLLFEVAYTPRARAADRLGKNVTERQIADRIYSEGWGRPLLVNYVDARVEEADVFDWDALVRDLVAAGEPEAEQAEAPETEAEEAEAKSEPAEAEEADEAAPLPEEAEQAEPEPVEAPGPKLVWDRLSAELQADLKRYVTAAEGAAEQPEDYETGDVPPADKPAPDLRDRLLAELNDIVENESFYQLPAFEGLVEQLVEDYAKSAGPEQEEEATGPVDEDEQGAEYERFALDTEDPAPRHRRWLNRRALNACLPAHVAQRYDFPLSGFRTLTATRFMRTIKRLLTFNFGRSEKTHARIGTLILRGMGPSLTLTVPIFIMGLVLSVSLSLLVAYLRGTYFDLFAVVVCVALMSVSILVYIIAGQYLLALQVRLFPVYGYAGGISAMQFLLLPIFIGVIKGLGGNVRFYRTVFAEEVGRDYVRTARAKGLRERTILFKHVLKNAMIPILTRTVLAIPFLILGSLLLENFFGIPGLGNLTVEAINSGDSKVVMAMVYLGALMFAVGNLLTDISYTFVDPRVTLR